jgi:FkbM family methyltransferase
VYDVGANNGDDTAYYLLKGYRVLAVEADPSLIPALEAGFAPDIARARLTLLNVALAPERKRAPFWICDEYRLWNSFDYEIASRLGRKCHAVEVECWPLRDIFSKYGIPYYLKLSLHGQEDFCLADLQPEAAPAYVSLQFPTDLERSDDILARLAEIGYHGFKLIDQRTYTQLAVTPPSLKRRLRRKLQQHPRLYDVCEVLSGLRKRVSSFGGNPAHSETQRMKDALIDWAFPLGSSGPLGDETHGRWQTRQAVRSAWKAFLSGDSDEGAPDVSVWHDLHATRLESNQIYAVNDVPVGVVPAANVVASTTRVSD